MKQQDWEYKVDNHISHIAENLILGRIGFLFGAGFSIPSGGIPGEELAYQLLLKGPFKYIDDKDPSTSNEYTEEELKELENIREVAQKYPLESLASGIVPNFPCHQVSLTNILKDVVFNGKEPECHNGHTHMSAIMNRIGLVRMLFTTNWDNLLELALGENSVPITNNNFMEINIEKTLTHNIGVIHLHGTFDDEPLFEENKLMQPDRPLFSLFIAELMTKSFVFVGYSLSDPNIRSLYFRVNEILTKQRKDLKKTTYVVFPPKNDIDRRVSEMTWLARNATYIPLSGEEFFDRLHELIKSKGVKYLKDKLLKRLDINNVSDLNIKIKEINTVFPDLDSPLQALTYLEAITRGGREHE
jgi:hypothetical protein